MRRLAVIGTGYVGLVTGSCFADIGNQVICCDIDASKIEKLNQGIIPIYEPGLQEMVVNNQAEGRLTFTTNIAEAVKQSDIIYIAVGTPMSPHGEADLTYIYAAAKSIAEAMQDYKIIVIKSTVPVGTGRSVQMLIAEHTPHPFDMVSNPEFLREGSALKDCMSMERAVIGATHSRAADAIEELHAPFRTLVYRTSLESAEMIKYAANAFLATKISFINEIANLCEETGANVAEVSTGMGLDSRIGSQFLQAGIGYGGSCFPKDTEALRFICSKSGVSSRLINAVIETNAKQRYVVLNKLQHALGNMQGRTIAVLGLAFKPNTDDMRYAPSVDLIPELVARGAHVKAYDPIALDEAKKWIQEDILYTQDMYEAVADADACLILTEWDQVKSMDLARLYSLMRQAVIVDGRNCFSLDEMSSHGFYYSSIGRAVVHSQLEVGIG